MVSIKLDAVQKFRMALDDDDNEEPQQGERLQELYRLLEEKMGTADYKKKVQLLKAIEEKKGLVVRQSEKKAERIARKKEETRRGASLRLNSAANVKAVSCAMRKDIEQMKKMREEC